MARWMGKRNQEQESERVVEPRRPFQEHDVVSHRGREGTIIHIYKRGRFCVLEIPGNGTPDIVDVALEEVTLVKPIEEMQG